MLVFYFFWLSKYQAFAKSSEIGFGINRCELAPVSAEPTSANAHAANPKI